MNIRIDHIAVYCLDLEAMRSFFVNHFCCRANDLYHNPKTGLRTYFLTFPDGETRLEIMSRPERDAIADNVFKSACMHIAIAVGSRDNVVEKTRELTDCGYKCVSGPRVTGDGYFESVVAGPEDIVLEITV